MQFLIQSLRYNLNNLPNEFYFRRKENMAVTCFACPQLSLRKPLVPLDIL